MVRTILIARRIAFFTLLTLFVTVAGSAQTKYKTYTNDCFFFEIEYPATFSMGEAEVPPANDDGRIFTSADGKAELRAWGEYNALFHTLKEEFDFEAKDFGATLSYQHLGKNWFVMSGVRNGRIIYQETLVRKEKDIDVFYSIRLEYPSAKKKKYDPIVGHIQHSLHWIPGSDV